METWKKSSVFLIREVSGPIYMTTPIMNLLADVYILLANYSKNLKTRNKIT